MRTESTTIEIQITDLLDIDERERRGASIVFVGPNTAEVAHLSSPNDAVVAGRLTPSDVLIDDPSLSRQHARFRWADGRLIVEDLGSKNGTWVTGRQVQSVVLSSGQEVLLGSVRAVVAIADVPVKERKTNLFSAEGGGDLVIADPVMRELYQQVQRAASLDIPVLILGETGTGKEHVARALHARGNRSGKPFKAVNCGAIPRELAESILFGHEKGAFSGAVNRGTGLFEQARGGVLFLDEIGELPRATQASLLRAVETGMVAPVGSSREIRVDARIVAATHCNLEAMVEEGLFRRDLLYRLNAVTLEVPPLRKRRDEIAPLAGLFLRRVCERWGWPRKRLDPSLIESLERYDWPGNIRQLRNVIERAVLLCSGDALRPEDLPKFVVDAEPAASQPVLSTLPPPPDDGEPDLSFKERLQGWEIEVISQALARTDGNVRAAARLLRMPHQTLVYKLKTYGMSGKDS